MAMQLRFATVALVGKCHTVATANMAQALVDVGLCLQTQGSRVILEERTAQHFAEFSVFARFKRHIPHVTIGQIGQQAQLVVVLGGDGTVLGVGRAMAAFDIPLLGINQGRLGFITDLTIENYAALLPAILMGDYTADRRSLMQGQLVRHGICMGKHIAMNDIVINRSTSSGMVELRVCIDGHFVANHRADGLIIANPTGSTAYALSAGGPLLHPSIAGWVMVPIAPHILSNRPVVLPDAVTIDIEWVGGRANHATANFDMQSSIELQAGDALKIQRSIHSVRFLHPLGWNYFDTLREKLHWNEGAAT